MVLKTISFFVLFVTAVCGYAQITSPPHQKSADTSVFPIINADFLFGYYEQDGIHSPVTGGKGTELLWDYAGQSVIQVQLDSFRTFTLDFGIDQYTSASTDNIDFNVSSASVVDSRKHINLDYVYTTRNRTSFDIGAGFSTEWDVNSWSVHASWNKRTKSDNSGIGFGAQFYHDSWDLIYPIEFRELSYFSPNAFLTNNVRTLAMVNLNAFHIVNKRMQVAVFADLMQQNGLLSTPFHRVFFTNGSRDIERLPDSKWKLPVSTRIHYFAVNGIALRWYNRFYVDAFDTKALTSKLDVSLKVNRNFSITPYYRWHTQTASRYFKPFMEHEAGSEFFTSDYDLSAFQSQRLGAAFQYTPVYGMLPFQVGPMKRKGQLKTLSLRMGYYMRSDGLKANYTSLGMSWLY